MGLSKPTTGKQEMYGNIHKRNYWEDNEEYPVSDWQYEVSCGHTRSGYHNWIELQKEIEDE